VFRLEGERRRGRNEPLAIRTRQRQWRLLSIRRWRRRHVAIRPTARINSC
jgi:hypothetical protein